MFVTFYIYQCKFKNTVPNIEIFQIKSRKTVEQKIALKKKKEKIEQFHWIGITYEICNEA